jgi:two-component system, LytTR family, sensor kinase
MGRIQAAGVRTHRQTTRGEPQLQRDERGLLGDEWEPARAPVAGCGAERNDPLMRMARSSALRLLAAWLGVALFFSAENLLVGAARHRPFDWQWDLYHEFVYAITWCAFSPLVLWAGRRRPLGSGPAGRTIGPHLLLMLALAPAQIVTTYTLHYLGLSLIGRAPAGTLLSFLLGLQGGIVWGTLTGFLYYWLILGIQAAFIYQRMYREQRVTAAELQGRLTEARLDALRLQLHPHFLFNTLNAISAFVPVDPERAQRMIVRLGDLLRRTLSESSSAELSLKQELELLEPYLEIQRIRFGERLSLELEVPNGTADALIPVLMLQPLVENAVEHGVGRTAGPARVRLSARRTGNRLRLEISDNGPGPLAGGRDGVGLANTRARLSGLYGDAHRFELHPLEAGGTLVAIELPFRSGD